MLPYTSRLRRPQDFRRIYEKSRTFSTESLTIRIHRRSDGAPVRIGIVVGTKLSKRAVERNKVRRRLREGLRRTTLMSERGFDLIIAARPSARERTYAELADECSSIVRRLTERRRATV